MLSAERMLLDPAVRCSVVDLEQLLDSEFMEIGASGRTWTRAGLIEERIASPNIDEELIDEMSARYVTGDVIVVEYTTSTPTRVVHRSSWWRQTEGRWRQGVVRDIPRTTIPACSAKRVRRALRIRRPRSPRVAPPACWTAAHEANREARVRQSR